MRKTCSFLVLFLAICSQAQTLVVANQHDRTISLVDPTSAKQIAVIQETVPGQWAHEIATSPDGRTAYAPIYGNTGVGHPGLDGSKMLVIDIPTRKITHTADFGRGVRPHCIVYDPNSKFLYVTTELAKSITIIDPKTLKIVGSIPTGAEQSHMFVISHDGRRGYTSNVSPGSVSVLDIPARKTISVIPISSNSQRIAISNDDRLVFTADQTKPQFAVIDTATNKVKSWIALPAVGYGTALTKDGRSLLIALPSINKVGVVDLATLKLTSTIDVCRSPQEILIRPDGEVAYASCADSNQVAAIDVKQKKVQHLIDVGKWCDGLAWAGAK